MLNIIIGIAIGAAFAPMWVKLWHFVVALPAVARLVAAIKGNTPNNP